MNTLLRERADRTGGVDTGAVRPGPRSPRAPRGWFPALLVIALAGLSASTLGAADLFLHNLFLVSALAAVALNLLMGTAGQVSIGGAAFLAVGGFGTALLQRSGLPFPLDVVGAAVLAGLVGLVVGFPALRLRGLYLAMSTLAAHFIVLHFVTQYQSDAVGTIGFQLGRAFGPQTLLDEQRLWLVVLTLVLVLTVLCVASLVSGRFGRAGRMVRDNEGAAPSLGMNVTRIKLTYFTLSSALIGLAGGLNAYLVGTVESERYSLALAISLIAMILIGGMDSIVGAIVGAALIVGLPRLVSDVLPQLFGAGVRTHGPEIAEMIYGAAIIVFVLASPDGVVGWLRRAWAKLGARGAS